MTLLAEVAYVGTHFAGCPEVEARRTVVGEVRAALARVGAAGVVEALSRTDAGVHARGQVLALVLDREEPEASWHRALERHLPADLRCHAVARVEALPRVVAKTYTYTLDVSRWGDPFLAEVAWRVPVGIDALAGLTAGLVGRHDFSAFRRRGETRAHLVRTITEAAWEAQPGRLVFRVSGDGFGYRMVRSLVGGMVCVAWGRCTPADWEGALAGHVTRASLQQAPARGLCLTSMVLDPEPRWVR